MSVAFAIEPVDEVWDEAVPLLRANHIEAGALTELEFQPDRDLYKHLDKTGCLRVWTARDDSKLVGYCVQNLLASHPHYKGTSWGSQDVLYVDPDYRGPMVVRFLKAQDEKLQDDGFQFSYRPNTFAKPYTRLLLHLGYRAQEVRYFRDLRKEVG